MSLLLFAVDSIRLPSRFSKKIAPTNVKSEPNNIYAVKTRYIVKKHHDAEFAIEVSYVDRGPLRLFNGTWSVANIAGQETTKRKAPIKQGPSKTISIPQIYEGKSPRHLPLTVTGTSDIPSSFGI